MILEGLVNARRKRHLGKITQMSHVPVVNSVW